MRLTALCVCGTLLALSSLSWTKADSGEGDLLGDKGYGPCAATLQPEEPCRQGQDENTCPYLFSLPPLTVHLPKQLKELEKIMKDLQKLKDNVDQLRKMCADCTVSQTERECGKQSVDERNWVNERNPKRLEDSRQGSGTNRVKAKKTIEGDDDTDAEKRTVLEERGRNKYEAENQCGEGAVKEIEKSGTLKELSEKEGKTQREGAKGKDKVGQAKVPTAGGNERIADMTREKVVEKNNRETETERNKGKDRKGDSKLEIADMSEIEMGTNMITNIKNEEKTEDSYHNASRSETKDTDKKTQTKEGRGSDGIKMSEEHDENTNKEHGQQREEMKSKIEKGMKVERNNEKPKPTESIGLAEKEKTIKEGEGEEGRGRDDAEAGFRSTGRPTKATVSRLGGPRQQISSVTTSFTSSTSPRPGAGSQGRVSSTTATAINTTPSKNLYTTIFPVFRDHSRLLAKKNISSNTKMGVKPTPVQGPKPGEKHEPGIKPAAEPKLKNPENNREPDQAPLPDNKTKPDQKQTTSRRKPTADQKPKPGKEPQKLHIPKLDQGTSPDNLTTDQNLKNNPIPNHDQDQSVQKSKSQKSIPHAQSPTSHQRPVIVNANGFDKDPLTNREHESVEITMINENSKPEKKPHRPLTTDKSDQMQKPEKNPKSGPKTQPDQRSEPDQYHTHVQKHESENRETSPTPETNQKSVAELMGNSDENPSPEPKSNQGSTPGQKLTLDHITILPEQKPEPSHKPSKTDPKPVPGHIPRLNQIHPEFATGQKIKSNVKPKPGQALQTKPGLETARPGQMPNLNRKSVPDEIPEAKSNKTSKPRPPLGHRPPTRLKLKPGATSVQRPRPAVQLGQSPKTKTDLDSAHIGRTISDGIKNYQTDMPPTSGPVKQTAKVINSPRETEFSPSTKKTISLAPKTSNGPESGPLPFLHSLPEGFTMSPNSRITSDLRPQTAGQPPSIPTTTRPNQIIRGILPSVIPSTSPGSTKLNLVSYTDSSLQAELLPNMEDTAPRQTLEPEKIMIPVPSAHPPTTSTLSPDFRSTTPATSGSEPPAAESSTPSARELRVKIKQVAAFFDNSLSPNGRSQDRHPKEQPMDNQGGSRPDRKPPMRIPFKATAVRRDCSDHLLRGGTKSGVYLVTPDIRGKSFPVFCDMGLAGGGWTLLQRRQDGSVSFNRTWAEYRSGFGDLHGGEFWLGNGMIHLLTRDRDMVLRVELEDFDGVTEHAEYEHFRVAGESLRFRLTVGAYSGTAGDALRFSKSYDHNNRSFTTPDRDNDRYPSGNCGAYYSSGWWFDACMAANLNGRYYRGRYTGVRDGIYWGTWHNISTEYYPTNDRRSFKTVRMMIRPRGFAP